MYIFKFTNKFKLSILCSSFICTFSKDVLPAVHHKRAQVLLAGAEQNPAVIFSAENSAVSRQK